MLALHALRTPSSNARLKFSKNQAIAKQHPEAKLLLFENYLPSTSHHHPKIIHLGQLTFSSTKISKRASVSVLMKLYDQS